MSLHRLSALARLAIAPVLLGGIGFGHRVDEGIGAVPAHARYAAGLHRGAPRQANSYVLPASLADMMKNERFYDWVNDKDNGPAWRGAPLIVQRECEGDATCNTGATTIVMIDAATEAEKLNLGAIPDRGVVIASVFIPKAAKKLRGERRYKFKADKDAFHYYFVVVPDIIEVDGLPAGRWYLIEVSAKKSKPVKSGVFHRCKNTTNSEGSHAGFSKCGTSARPVSHARVESLLLGLRRTEQNVRITDRVRADSVAMWHKRIMAEFIDPESGPAWITCIHGCCVAEED